MPVKWRLIGRMYTWDVLFLQREVVWSERGGLRFYHLHLRLHTCICQSSAVCVLHEVSIRRWPVVFRVLSWPHELNFVSHEGKAETSDRKSTWLDQYLDVSAPAQVVSITLAQQKRKQHRLDTSGQMDCHPHHLG